MVSNYGTGAGRESKSAGCQAFFARFPEAPGKVANMGMAALYAIGSKEVAPANHVCHTGNEVGKVADTRPAYRYS